MNTVNDIEDIRKKYEELQLRVTRFSAIEQELINTRDRLDHELVVYKRLQAFNLRALKLKEISELIQLISETIVDVFEVESAVVLFYDKHNETEEIAVEGIYDEDLARKLIDKSMSAFDGGLKKEDTTQLSRSFFVENNLEDYSSGLAYLNSPSNSDFKLILVATISEKNAPLYGIIDSNHKALYTVMAHKAISLIRNLLSNSQIEEQVQLIKASELNLLERNEELKKINNELDRFVYSVSHDLRSPLLAIKGVFDLIFQVCNIDKETEEYMRMAEIGVNRLDDTIQEILAYSRNARLDVVLESFDVKPMVEEI